MTTLLERTTTTHPLEATLQKMQASFTWTTLHAKPEGEGWYSYQDIIKQESGVFELLLKKYHQHAPYLNKRQAVQNLFNSLSWWSAAACYAPVLIDERSPFIAGGLHFHLHDEGYIDTVALEFGAFRCLPNDEAATHADASVVSGPEELVSLSLAYLQQMIQPVMNVAKIHAAIQDKALWLYVADDLTGLVLHVKQALEQQETCQLEVESVLGQLPERGQTGVLEVHHAGSTEYYCKRSTCCFYYLAPEGDKCSTCPKLPLEARITKLQDYIAKKAQQEPTKVAT
jgi:ferric iron reductase protein FhuF